LRRRRIAACNAHASLARYAAMSKDTTTAKDTTAASHESALPMAALAGAGAALLALVAIPAPFLLPALRKHCLPYVAANAQQLELLEKACRRRGVEGAAKRIVDLGSGDGVVCVELAKRLGVKARGVELNPWLVYYSRYSAWRENVGELCTFECGDLFKADVSDADAVALFVVPAMMADLEKKLARELPPDACVLAARFPLATWPETRHDVHTVKSRGYNVNQLWEYELDPAVRALREEPSSSPR
jgi:SAM-dependent methyltransferase